jgi:hypothetical protein
MVDRFIRIGAIEDGFGYDDADFPGAAIETDQPIKAGPPVAGDDVLRKDDMPDIVAGGLSASLLVDTNAASELDSVDDLTDYIAGTANEITVIDDGDGTITIEGAGSDTDFTVVVAIQVGGAGAVGFQYKTRDLTLNGGIITTVGAESAWNDV